MEMPSVLDQLVGYNAKARVALRSGLAPEDKWFLPGAAFISNLTAFKDYVYDDELLTAVLQARRRFADLADRIGRQTLAAELIGPTNYVPWALGQLEMEESPNELPGKFTELLWYVVVHALVQHRKGDVDRALELARKAYSHAQRLPGDHLALRHRLAFALGRHSQSVATTASLQDAESYYTEALKYCEKLARKNPERGEVISDERKRQLDAENSGQSDRATYARYRLAVTLTALARLFLERGELARALRECYAAETLFDAADPSPDELTSSYVKYLIGCIRRQQGQEKDLKVAVKLLTDSSKVFIKHKHRAHSLRCRHELAKAYFNQGDFDQALRTLGKVDEAVSPWTVNDLLLQGRILLEQAFSESGTGERELSKQEAKPIRDIVNKALAMLGVVNTQLRSRDILTRALSLLGELDLAERHPERIMKGWSFSKGERETLLDSLNRPGKTPLDKTDAGWGWLVLARAYVGLRSIADARSCMEHYRELALENTLFNPLALKTQSLIEFKAKEIGGFWLEPLPKELVGDKPLEKGLKQLKAEFHIWLKEQLQPLTKQRTHLEWEGLFGDTPYNIKTLLGLATVSKSKSPAAPSKASKQVGKNRT